MKKVYVNNFLIVSFFIILIFNSCDTTEPQPTDFHNKILFTSSKSGKPQLYMTNPDGSGIRQITSGNYWHTDGRWSPDAKQIVCNTLENSSTAGLEMVVMNVDGSNRKLLGYGNQMSWHPDGKKIAFSYMPSAELGNRTSYIYIITTDSNKVTMLTNAFGAYETIPAWAHDGKTIYFSSNRHNVEVMAPEIYSINTETLETRRITVTPNGYSTSPSISNTGDKIAFVSTWNGLDKACVFIMNKNGTEVELITQPPTNEVFNYPRWSLDGEKLIVVSGVTDGSARIFIYEIDIKNKTYKKLIDDYTAKSPDWSW